MLRSQDGLLLPWRAITLLLLVNVALAAVQSRRLGNVLNIDSETLNAERSPSVNLPRRVPVRERVSTAARTFKTEPHFEELNFEVLGGAANDSRLAPGYIFLTIQGPYQQKHGPAIYDTNGTLIWFHDVTAQDFQVCDYLGQRGTHLCSHNWPAERKEIFDQSYRMVTSIHNIDNHEFNVLPGGHSFVTAGDFPIKWDLTPYTGESDGWVDDCHLKEYDIKSGKLTFEWYYLDHLPIWATHLWIKLDGPLGKINSTLRTTKAGLGTYDSRWAIGHANAADVADGDYYFSLRHMDQILKIAGPQNRHGLPPGSVIWRLGGTGSDIELQNFNFTRQHHVRVHSVTSNLTTISIFNNGWDGVTEPSVKESSGKLIRINNQTMQAELVQNYPHPNGVIAGSRGSTQVLPNGNVLVGYGRYPDFIEYDQNGTILHHVRFTRFEHKEKFKWRHNEYSYRTFKYPWVGLPDYPPKVLAYAQNCNINTSSPLMVYVSWNGATEVDSWRVSFGTTPNGPWIAGGIFPKTGFETSMNFDSHPSEELEPSGESSTKQQRPYVRVEGLRVDQTILGSATVKIFVPRNPKLWSCDESGCANPTSFIYSKWKSIDCCSSWTMPLHVAAVVLIIEVVSILHTAIWFASCGLVKSRSPNPAYEAVLGNDKNKHTEGMPLQLEPSTNGKIIDNR